MLNNDSKTVWNFTEKGIVGVVGQANNVSVSFEEAYPLVIGANHQGGIIFYLDASKEHGLIAAPSDLKDSKTNTYVTWYNGSFSTTGATSPSNGKENTSAIVVNQGIGDYAAKLCDDFVLGEYSDWYLPSRDELDLMYRNIGYGATAPLTNVGHFTSSEYWSSSEVDNYSAWGQNFENGDALNYYEGNALSVRAIRAF